MEHGSNMMCGSMWDSFRSIHPLFNILDPAAQAEMVSNGFSAGSGIKIAVLTIPVVANST